MFLGRCRSHGSLSQACNSSNGREASHFEIAPLEVDLWPTLIIFATIDAFMFLPHVGTARIDKWFNPFFVPAGIFSNGMPVTLGYVKDI